MKSITLKDIAKKVGVSEATISLVLNNKDVVNVKTREKVLHCIKEMNYTPNPLARGLALHKSMTVGLVCPDSENPYYGKLMKLLSHYCNEYGYSLVLAVSNNDFNVEADIVKNFINKKFDGIIILPLNEKENKHPIFKELRERSIATVFCTSYYKGFQEDCVLTDYAQGSYLLTKHLLDLGHRELWFFVTKDKSIPVTKYRLDGMKKAYSEMNLEMKGEWIIGCETIDVEYGYEKAKALLKSKRCPDAILALNDYMAYGIKRAIVECGYKIPEDISLVGYDDVFYHLISEQPLTTVHQDLDSLAKNTVDLLMQKMNDNFEAEEPIHKIINPSIIIRNTTSQRLKNE